MKIVKTFLLLCMVSAPALSFAGEEQCPTKARTWEFAEEASLRAADNKCENLCVCLPDYIEYTIFKYGRPVESRMVGKNSGAACLARIQSLPTCTQR